MAGASSPFPIRIEEVDGAGRGAFASQDIASGTVVMRCAAAAAVLSNEVLRGGRVCAQCLQDVDGRGADAARCPACNLAVLCGRCQADPAAVALHDDECGSLQALFRHDGGCAVGQDGTQTTDAIRCVVRLLAMRRRWLDGKPPLLTLSVMTRTATSSSTRSMRCRRWTTMTKGLSCRSRIGPACRTSPRCARRWPARIPGRRRRRARTCCCGWSATASPCSAGTRWSCAAASSPTPKGEPGCTPR